MNQMQFTGLRAAEMFQIEFGSYSDHTILGPFVATRNITPEDMERVYNEARQYRFDWDDEDDPIRTSSLLAAMIRAGMIAEIPIASLHIGDHFEVEHPAKWRHIKTNQNRFSWYAEDIQQCIESKEKRDGQGEGTAVPDV